MGVCGCVWSGPCTQRSGEGWGVGGGVDDGAGRPGHQGSVARRSGGMAESEAAPCSVEHRGGGDTGSRAVMIHLFLDQLNLRHLRSPGGK